MRYPKALLCFVFSLATLSACTDRVVQICGAPPEFSDRTRSAEIEASVSSLRVGEANLQGKIQDQSTQIFRNTPDETMPRANAYYQYQACAFLVRSDLSDEEILNRIDSVRSAIEGSVASVEGERAQCISNRINEVSKWAGRDRQSARASGPGLAGGSNTGTANASVIVPPGFQVLSREVIRHGCFGNRCRHNIVEASEASGLRVTAQLEAWSESASGGAGGLYDGELVVTAERPVTDDDRRDAGIRCGAISAAAN